MTTLKNRPAIIVPATVINVYDSIGRILRSYQVLTLTFIVILVFQFTLFQSYGVFRSPTTTGREGLGRCSRDSSQPRIAICLVGGARRFELTGPSLLDRVVNAFNNSDLFLNSPLDDNSYKLSLLKGACRIAAVRIVRRTHVEETQERRKTLTAVGSPSGLQGLLYYFKLVEGCLDTIEEHQAKSQIQYDWIVRTRVDGYWSAPLSPSFFVPGTYVIPSGYRYGGLNDRLGVGDPNTSRVALSRLSMVPELYAARYRRLRSEPAFHAQLALKKVPVKQVQVPFCIMSDRSFHYPPRRHGTPVGSVGSQSPLSGAYCRPCRTACNTDCASKLLHKMDRHWGWIDSVPELCDAQRGWGKNWTQHFDAAAGEKYANVRKRVGSLGLDRCVAELEMVRNRTHSWDAPSPAEICRAGLRKKPTG